MDLDAEAEGEGAGADDDEVGEEGEHPPAQPNVSLHSRCKPHLCSVAIPLSLTRGQMRTALAPTSLTLACVGWEGKWGQPSENRPMSTMLRLRAEEALELRQSRRRSSEPRKPSPPLSASTSPTASTEETEISGFPRINPPFQA